VCYNITQMREYANETLELIYISYTILRTFLHITYTNPYLGIMLYKRVRGRQVEFHSFFALAIVLPDVLLPIFVLFTGCNLTSNLNKNLVLEVASQKVCTRSIFSVYQEGLHQKVCCEMMTYEPSDITTRKKTHNCSWQKDVSKWVFPVQCCRNYGCKIINPLQVKKIKFNWKKNTILK
jgi:hypothetical protein